MAIGAIFTNAVLFLCRGRAVSARNILFFLGLALDTPWCFRGRCFFEHNATRQSLADFLISYLTHIRSSQGDKTTGLMMEQADARKCHGNAILVTSGNHMVITHAAAGLRHIFHPALMGTLNVVAKREEGV